MSVKQKNNDLESPERRDALEMLGKMALYVPPAMATLLLTSRSIAASPPTGEEPPAKDKDNNACNDYPKPCNQWPPDR